MCNTATTSISSSAALSPFPSIFPFSFIKSTAASPPSLGLPSSPSLPSPLSLSHFNLKCFQFYSRVELTTPDVKLPTKSIIISLQKRIFQSLASAFEKWKI